ncbi:MAG: DUF5916 domain-containing protein [Pseudomonadales bacterium]|nr:DUF5916 domain-containing protein [Pseudomonadales bacterium]
MERRGTLAAVLFCLTLVGYNSAAGAETEPLGGAVVGSYLSLVNAEHAVGRIDSVLGDAAIKLDIVPARVSGRDWFRVIAHDRTGVISGRRLTQRLSQLGFSGAWFIAKIGPQSSSRAQMQSDSRERTQQAGSTVAVAPPLPQAVQVTPSTVSDHIKVQQPVQALVGGRGASLVNESGPRTPEVIETLGGVDRHGFDIPSFQDSELDIVLDGRLDETFWQQIPYYDEFMVAVPDLGIRGEHETHVRFFTSEKGLYVGAIMYQPVDTLVKRYSVRDDFLDRDSFGVNLDTSGEGLVGYWFMVALGGNVQDGKILPERNYSRDWDGPWIGKSAEREDGWSAEAFFPWSMMNVPEVDGKRSIGLLANRQVSYMNHRYQWPGYAYSSARFLSAFNRVGVEGVDPVPLLSAIPYASMTLDEASGDEDLRVGADISWKPSPSLEGTLSVNPDFGAVEADDVVLNLTASETFFPEKRLFFLEGNEVFEAHPRAGLGYISRIISNEDFASTSRRVYSRDFLPTPVSLLNTRRIGGAARQVEVPSGVTPNRGQPDIPTDLLGAVKLTGSVGDVRYGVMSAFEDEVEWLGTDDITGLPVDIVDDGRDFAVARFLYEDIGENRRSIGYLGTAMQGEIYDSYVHSIDAHYTSSSGKVIVDTQLINSDRDDAEGYGAIFDLMYAVNSTLRHKFEVEYMDERVNFNDLGFLRRNNYAQMRYIMLYNKQNLTERIKNYRSTVVLEQQYNIDPGQVINSGVYWRNSMVLPGRNTLKATFAHLPERWEDFDSRGNGAYRVDARNFLDILLATNAAHMFSFSGSVGGQQEHLGDWTLNGSFGVTVRPSNQFSLKLDLQYKKRDGWLVYQGGRNFGSYEGTEWQPAIDFNWYISHNHQIRLSMQWAGVRARETDFLTIPVGDGDLVPGVRTMLDHDFTVSLLTAQLRYRWEIAPLTDLFLVYNRGNSLPNQTDSPFDDLFDDVLRDPLVDSFVAKLRWRFGN